MYHKRCTGVLIIQKYTPSWVKWVHHSEGKTHCEECLMLDGCWFLESKVPMNPHHPYCHCTLDQINYAIVLMNSAAYSDYRKFDPYLFNTHGDYTHTKEKLFAQWGYTVDDAHWLQAEMERQGREKYIIGDYKLGKLNEKGQRISIRIEIPRACLQIVATPMNGCISAWTSRFLLAIRPGFRQKNLLPVKNTPRPWSFR